MMEYLEVAWDTEQPMIHCSVNKKEYIYKKKIIMK